MSNFWKYISSIHMSWLICIGEYFPLLWTVSLRSLRAWLWLSRPVRRPSCPGPSWRRGSHSGAEGRVQGSWLGMLDPGRPWILPVTGAGKPGTRRVALRQLKKVKTFPGSAVIWELGRPGSDWLNRPLAACKCTISLDKQGTCASLMKYTVMSYWSKLKTKTGGLCFLEKHRWYEMLVRASVE